jgi:hypothetical protein
MENRIDDGIPNVVRRRRNEARVDLVFEGAEKAVVRQGVQMPNESKIHGLILGAQLEFQYWACGPRQ